MTRKEVDVAIVGGGLTGAALMLALEGSGLDVLLVESQDFSDKLKPDFDARSVALSQASVAILKMLSIWPRLESQATPIETIHISQQAGFAHARLGPKETGPLGHVVEMPHIASAMQQLLKNKSILNPATVISMDKLSNTLQVQVAEEQINIKAQLVVAADGSNSTLRKLTGLPVRIKTYQQVAITANIALKRSHHFQAFERFTQTGSIALLPISKQRAALVFALPASEAQAMMALDDARFLKQLQTIFGYRLGRFEKVGRRACYPLQQWSMPRSIAWPLVFIGNAAQTLHPIAGQGFNLGLRDAAMLAQCVRQYGLNASMLQTYQSLRRFDKKAIATFTDGLVEIFGSRIIGLNQLRSLGLLAIDTIPSLQNWIAHYAGGFAGHVPDLACGIPLGLGSMFDARL